MATNTFDPKCFDLALHFLKDEPTLDRPECRRRLSILIQEAVEDGIDELKREYKCHSDPATRHRIRSTSRTPTTRDE